MREEREPVMKRSDGRTTSDDIALPPASIHSLRGAIEYLDKTGEMLRTQKPVDPDVEVIALQKYFDGGSALLFDKIIGYDNARVVTNVMATKNRLWRLFEANGPNEFKRKFIDAIQQPLKPRIVESAPVQEVVIRDNVDVWPIIPMLSHTKDDPGRTLGGGITLVSGRHFWGGTHVAYNRMNFREPNTSSFQISPGSHGDMIASEWYRKGPIPMTINIGAPPAVVVVASAGFLYMLLHRGCDELGVAGGLQGGPVDIVKAKTVDAYAIAEAEYVIEGYVDSSEKIWESDQAEASQMQGVHPFHPEWSGYMGKAYRTQKFVATALTYRKDRPIYHAMGVHMEEVHNLSAPTREAMLQELADRISPDICVDVHIPWSMTDWGGVIFQVRKRRRRDEGTQINMMSMALAISRGMRVAIAVDDDVDIESLDDVMWAISTRVNPASDIQRAVIGGLGQTFQPAERTTIGGAEWTASNLRFPGGVMIDATVPFEHRDAFERPMYPVDRVDPREFFSAEDVRRGLSSQVGWARYLARKGY